MLPVPDRPVCEIVGRGRRAASALVGATAIGDVAGKHCVGSWRSIVDDVHTYRGCGATIDDGVVRCLNPIATRNHDPGTTAVERADDDVVADVIRRSGDVIVRDARGVVVEVVADDRESTAVSRERIDMRSASSLRQVRELVAWPDDFLVRFDLDSVRATAAAEMRVGDDDPVCRRSTRIPSRDATVVSATGRDFVDIVVPRVIDQDVGRVRSGIDIPAARRRTESEIVPSQVIVCRAPGLPIVDLGPADSQIRAASTVAGEVQMPNGG